MVFRKSVAAFTIVLSLTCSLAQASGWSAPVQIGGYYIQAQGGALLTTNANQNPDGCSTSHWLTLDQTAINFKELYATIMAAQATGQTVSLFYDGCAGGYPLITAVAVPQSW